jgi:hypothetical protein
VVTGQDEYIVIASFHDEIQILVNGISRALIPIRLLASYIGLEQVNATLLPIQVPGFANTYVIVQRVGTILRQNCNIGDTRIDAITQGKINDTIFASERDRWLGSFV